MNDEILKRLEQKLDRRSFLRGSGLAAAALVGMAAAAPLVAFAQEKNTKGTKDAKGTKGKDAKDKDAKDKDKDKAKNKESDSTKDESKDPSEDKTADTETKIDDEGREYRVCPQCGSNMYRQGRTWTCENCGYSYVE